MGFNETVLFFRLFSEAIFITLFQNLYSTDVVY